MTSQASFRFYEELNDFLPHSRRKREFVHHFADGASIKDVIEGLGVPHTEVDLILVNGDSVGFDYRAAAGDRISVFPKFESLDIGPVTRLRPRPLRDPRFIADANLGRLAAYLRLFGFDTSYRGDYRDDELASLAGREARILLTRDRQLLKRSCVTRGYCVRSDLPRDQVREVLQRFDLCNRLSPFTRCLRCNTEIRRVAREDVLEQLPPRTHRHYRDFQRCPACNRIYWKGSHYGRMRRFIDEACAPRPCGQ